MRYLSTLLFLVLGVFISTSSFAQTVTIDEDFSDGDFANNPTWTDSESKHIVNTSDMLQLDAPSETDEAAITTTSTAAYGEWEAYLEFGFNPSGSNLARFYIISDTQDIKEEINGYFIQVGDTPDEVSLYRQDGSNTTKIIDGTDGLVDSNPVNVRIRVTRDLDGNWELFADASGGTSFTSQGTTTDDTYTTSNYIGLFSDYSSTRSDLFEYDDIKITKVNPPLSIQQVDVVDNQTIDVLFNLDIDPASVQEEDFSIDNGIEDPNTTNLPTSNTVRLIYESPISSGEYILTVNDIDDTEGNTINKNTTVPFHFFGSFAQGDIIINEFAYDYPTTLSEEYIELKNTSNKYLNLANWEIADNNSKSSLGSDPIPIEPNSFLVISADTTELYNIFGDRDYHETSFPALNNTTPDAVQLITEDGSLADSLTYDSDWGGTDVALERRSASAPSTFQENWGDSPHPDGGTPGAANEVAEDDIPPQFTDLNILSTQTIQLVFDERLEKIGSYSITNSSVSSADPTAPDTVELMLKSNLKNAQDYTLSVGGAEDIFGNSTSADTSFTYFEPSPADSGDIVINEFMYAPPAESSEYIELYNHSDKSLDLEGWTLSDNRENFEGTITNGQFIVPPDSFVIIAPDNTIKTEYEDIALVTMRSFPALNNGGDAIVIRSNDDTLLDSLSYISDWGGDEIALERRTVDVSGTHQSNWGDAPNGFGTPGSANEIDPDTEPPTVEHFSILNNSELLLTFSEPLNKSTAGNSDNYTLSNNSISNASFSGPDSVLLSVGDHLQNATEYILDVEQVSDLFGNAISPTDTTFTYYEISSADSGDVFINEFNFVPVSGSTEYVEIYNSTSKSFDLQGWTLNDNRGIQTTITSSQFVIPPDSFAVIAPDNTLLSHYPDIALVSLNSFPALNNSGDNLVIRNENGILLDSLQYNSEWGGNEIALERRTTSISGFYQENWGDAPNGFGTPGTANEVNTDETPPAFEELLVDDASTLTLRFSENIQNSSATNLQNYQIIPNQDIQLISAENSNITLFLDEELSSGETYEVTVSNISDIFGNILSDATKEVEFLRIDQARYGDLVINEILYNPGSGEADFVELYNPSNKNFDLSNWIIGDSSNETSISQNIQLQANSYLVLTGSSTLAQNSDNIFEISSFPALNNNTPDDIYIRTEDNHTIDSLRYFQSWGGSEEGTSLERKDPQAASNDASNWQTSSTESGNSAGAQNISFQEDTNPPEVIFSKVLSDGNFEVQFNEFIRLTDDVQFLSGNQRLEVAEFDSTNANVVTLTSKPSKSSEADNITITVQNLSDIKGNTTSSSSKVEISQPMELSDLVINEIMFNPLSDSEDNRPDQSEYIELRNTRDYAISLEGLVLHDEPDENGEVRDLIPVSSTAKWVPAGGHVLIHADGATTFEESHVANFFELEAPNMQSVMRIDRSSLSLVSTGDAIFIADSTGATIDSVFYSEEWHNPNIIDTRGVALERVTPDGSSNDDSNWGSSVNEKGGTPNSENSIYQESANSPQETGISFTPNPFSPDDDGHEDNLFINYKLDHQDYLIDVQVYDRYGRLIRELADGKQAGFEGQLIWDGRKDNNSRNRIGIYIVVLEAYDSSTGGDQTFKETVVLARKLN